MTDRSEKEPIEAYVVAVPETAGSALYGMIDVLAAAGNLWQALVGTEEEVRLIQPRIISPLEGLFSCGNRIPVSPDFDLINAPDPDIVILPELWLGPDEHMHGRYPELMEWIRQQYHNGASIYSGCSGSIMLAETGLLDGRDATSHWGYERLFRNNYPDVRFNAEPILTFGDAAGRIVTAGGTTSWHDLAIHIISRHCSPGEALRIAKVYLLKMHSEGQLPYASLISSSPHADSVVRACEDWLRDHFRGHEVVGSAVAASQVPERTLKRRFKTATGLTLIDYVQNLRIEEAKRMLESTDTPIEAISVGVGYENPAFFGRLFKRRTGLTPGQYRRMFQNQLVASADAPEQTVAQEAQISIQPT
jgi:transcriptional regulator GlxA family with amidase domain